MEHIHLFGCEETPFTATYVFLGQAGKRNTVEVNYLIPYFLEYTTNNAVLSRVNLQTNMLAVLFGELQRVGDDTLVVQYDTGTNDSFVHFLQLTVESNCVDLLLMELRVRQLSCQVTIVGKQQYTGGITVETTYRIDALLTGITHDIDDGMTLLRVVGGRHRVLRFIEQDIDLTFATNGLVMETNIIRRQHFNAQRISYYSIDSNDTGLNKIIRLSTGTDTCVSKVLIQTNRLRQIFMLLTINLLFMSRIESVITFGFTSERTVRTVGALAVGRTFAVKRAMRTIGSLYALWIKTESSGFVTFAVESGTSRNRFALSAEARTRSALTIVGIVVKHVFSKH